MKISIIIPTLNEEKKIETQLNYLKALKGNFELIVADGRSEDNTLKIAKKFKVKIETSNPGRGIQLNAGAKLATGDILLFLHVDTILPKNFYKLITSKIRLGYVGGGFFVKHDVQNWQLRLIEFVVNTKAKIRGVKLGDQTIFVTNKAFKEIGGFPNIKLMEDYVFAKKIRKYRTCIINEYVITSARKFLKHGPIRTYLMMGIFQIKYLLGVSPEKLYSQYYSTKD